MFPEYVVCFLGNIHEGTRQIGPDKKQGPPNTSGRNPPRGHQNAKQFRCPPIWATGPPSLDAYEKRQRIPVLIYGE